ncbi:MAG: hypothetical protein ABII13_03550 [Patescibacteria group bacterium]|nr:hypothetical protein [Patescibacteria group bacterium]MBU2509162.1 hypothetical protein [Patescibacteria group bacterium]
MQSNTTDKSIKIQDRKVGIDDFVTWVTRNKGEVSAPLLAKVEINIGTREVILGVVTGGGFDVRTKQQLDVPFGECSDFVTELVIVPGEFRFFMGTPGLFTQATGDTFTSMDLGKLINGLALIRGKDKKSVSDIYLVGPQIDAQLIQYVQMPTGEIFYLSRPGQRGITNVRFVGGKDFNVLIGTTVNEQGIPLAIRMFPLHRILSEERSVLIPDNWNNTIKPSEGRSIVRMGRSQIIKGTDDKPVIRTVVHLEGPQNTYYECVLTLTMDDRRHYTPTWGQEYRIEGTRIPIGSVIGYNGIFISAVPDKNMAHVLLETLKSASPMAREYLRTYSI